MTTQKLFKRRVRERMSKTGESYTSAHRQVVLGRERLETSRNRLASAKELASDEKLTEVTGLDWQAWLTILDEWGARERRHREIADFLIAEHGVPGWYAQAITTGYERARGLRQKHQQATGFTVYASKTVGVPFAKLFDAFVDEPIRTRWLTDAALTPRSSQAGKTARFDVDGGPTRILVTFEAKGPGKSTAHVAHERLPDADAGEAAKVAWKDRLASLKAFAESTDA